MEFLKKLFSPKKEEPAPAEPDIVELRGNGAFALEVVGESNYQSNLETICGARTEAGAKLEIEASLIMEDNNPKDKNAVRVEINNLQVGYLGRQVAPLYREQLRQAGHPKAIGTCRAKVRGGWIKKSGDVASYGVWLDIPVETDEDEE